VYTIFQGKTGILDQKLAEHNQLMFIRDVSEVNKIQFKKETIKKGL